MRSSFGSQKPTPSIAQRQETANEVGREIDMEIGDASDPVIVPRAVVVVGSGRYLVDLLFGNMICSMIVMRATGTSELGIGGATLPIRRMLHEILADLYSIVSLSEDFFDAVRKRYVSLLKSRGRAKRAKFTTYTDGRDPVYERGYGRRHQGKAAPHRGFEGTGLVRFSCPIILPPACQNGR